MQKFKFTFFLAIILFNLLSCERKTKLLIATDPNWPPMEFTNENNQLVGFDIDLMREIAKKGKFIVEFTNVSWENIFLGLESNLYDAVIADVGITEERKKIMDFSFPYLNDGQVLVIRKELNNITNLNQMIGKKVGAQENTIGAYEIQKVKDVIFIPYKNISDAFSDLYSKNIDGLVCGLSTAANQIMKYSNYNSYLMITGKPFTFEPSGIAIKKGNNYVKNLINNSLKQVLYEKINEKLENKWLRQNF